MAIVVVGAVFVDVKGFAREKYMPEGRNVGDVQVVAGGVCGLAAKKNNFSLDRKKVILLTVACELIITVMNTGVMYVDSKMYGYYFPGYITGSLLIRLVICVVKAVAFGAVLPTLVNSVKKYLA